MTDMTHYLDERGIPVAHGPAGRWAGFLGAIVSAASQHDAETPIPTALRCRRRPGRKPCPGRLWALRREDGLIEWQCGACDDSGLIHHWENTPWDFSAFRPPSGSAGEGGAVDVEFAEAEYGALRRLFILSREDEAVVHRALLFGEGTVLLTGTREEWESFAECVAAEANHARDRRTRALLESVIDRIDAALAESGPPSPAPPSGGRRPRRPRRQGRPGRRVTVASRPDARQDGPGVVGTPKPAVKDGQGPTHLVAPGRRLADFSPQRVIWKRSFGTPRGGSNPPAGFLPPVSQAATAPTSRAFQKPKPSPASWPQLPPSSGMAISAPPCSEFNRGI